MALYPTTLTPVSLYPQTLTRVSLYPGTTGRAAPCPGPQWKWAATLATEAGAEPYAATPWHAWAHLRTPAEAQWGGEGGGTRGKMAEAEEGSEGGQKAKRVCGVEWSVDRGRPRH